MRAATASHAERRFAFTRGSRGVMVFPAVDPGLLLLAAVAARRDNRRLGLPGGTSDVGGDDVGSVPVQAAAGPLWWSYRIVVRRSACETASWTSRSGTPASSAAVMNACLSVCGVTALVITARRATLRTIRPAPCRSSRRLSAPRNTGPSVRSPMARSIARAGCGASGIVTTLPPLRVIVKVRCPRSRPRCSMSAPVTSETRRPFRASREISACSSAEPSPAATSSVPSSHSGRAGLPGAGGVPVLVLQA